MPVYDYLCETCGNRFEEVKSIHDDGAAHTPCSLCASRGIESSARRIVTKFPGVVHGLVTNTHYNQSVGKVISNDAEFKSELSRQSDELSERNQFPVDFKPIDHREAKEHLGVTDEGMDSTYSERVRTGEREVTKHL